MLESKIGVIFGTYGWVRFLILAGEVDGDWPMDAVEFFGVVAMMDFFEVSGKKCLLLTCVFGHKIQSNFKKKWNYIL